MTPQIEDRGNVLHITLSGVVLQKFVYGDDEDRREKMARAYAWCDGYECGRGKPLKQVGEAIS